MDRTSLTYVATAFPRAPKIYGKREKRYRPAKALKHEITAARP